jgi:hypothetical protein
MDSVAYVVVPYQYLSAPQHFFNALTIPIGVIFDPHRPYRFSL